MPAELQASIKYSCSELLMECPPVDLRLAVLVSQKHSERVIWALVTQMQML